MSNSSTGNSAEQRAPAYIPFKTFLTAVETLEQGIPPTLDRSVWPSFSGGTQSQILGAFKFLGLIKENGKVEPILERLVNTKGDERREVMREMIENSYPEAIQLAENNVSFAQLQEHFRGFGVQASTLEKVVRFYLDACEYTKIKCSPLWATAKKTSRRYTKKDEGSTIKPKERKRKGVSPDSDGKPSTEWRTIQLRSGGKFSYSLSVDLVTLSKEDRDWLFNIIDQLNEYERIKDTE